MGRKRRRWRRLGQNRNKHSKRRMEGNEHKNRSVSSTTFASAAIGDPTFDTKEPLDRHKVQLFLTAPDYHVNERHCQSVASDGTCFGNGQQNGEVVHGENARNVDAAWRNEYFTICTRSHCRVISVFLLKEKTKEYVFHTLRMHMSDSIKFTTTMRTTYASQSVSFEIRA